MAVTSKMYGPALQSLVAGEINFAGSTVKAMLCTSTYTPNQDTHRYKSSVTNETTGTGYTAGGVTLASKVVSYDSASNTLSLDANDPTWPGATFSFRYLVFYVDTGTASTSPLLSYVDFETTQSVTAATFTYTIPTAGLLTITAAA